MENFGAAASVIANRAGSSSASSSPPSSAAAAAAAAASVIMSPCAACKILRRRCADNCVLAPYFPPTEPAKFTMAHRVFGASNIIKFLQELPESQRADAVSSMVYEASARIRDPVYGSAGAICQLQKLVNELQGELAKAQAEVVNLQCQQANLVALLCMEMEKSPESSSVDNFIIRSPAESPEANDPCCNFFDDNSLSWPLWEPTLWT